MRLESVVLVRLENEQQRKLLEMGLLSVEQALSGNGFIEYRFEAHSEELERLIEHLEEAGADYFVREERSFSRREIRSAQALHISPAAKIPDGGTVQATGYDWSDACERCMRTPKQTGSLSADINSTPESALLRGKRGELIVKENVGLRMIKEGISGAILKKVDTGDNPDSKDGNAYFQIVPTSVLPRLVSPPTRFSLTDDMCAVCSQGGLHLESMLFYDLPLEEIEDINLTCELFGEGPELAPEIVVSPKFYNLLVAAGADLEMPEPIMFV